MWAGDYEYYHNRVGGQQSFCVEFQSYLSYEVAMVWEDAGGQTGPILVDDHWLQGSFPSDECIVQNDGNFDMEAPRRDPCRFMHNIYDGKPLLDWPR